MSCVYEEEEGTCVMCHMRRRIHVCVCKVGTVSENEREIERDR